VDRSSGLGLESKLGRRLKGLRSLRSHDQDSGTLFNLTLCPREPPSSYSEHADHLTQKHSQPAQSQEVDTRNYELNKRRTP